LNIIDFRKFAFDKAIAIKYLPIKKKVNLLPRDYLVNFLFSLDGQNFKNRFDQIISNRNEQY
jgi:hypothetical protein